MHRAEVLDEETYEAFLSDVQLVIDACPPGLLASGTGHGKVTIGKGKLRLNGQYRRPSDAQCDTILAWLETYAVKTLYLESQRAFFYREEMRDDYREFYTKYDGSHETLCIDRIFDTSGYVSRDERGWLFDCTKTAQKPYDTAVVAILILLAAHFPEACALSSDGHAEEWRAGLALAREATGKEWLAMPPEIKTRVNSYRAYLAQLLVEGERYAGQIEGLRQSIAKAEAEED